MRSKYSYNHKGQPHGDWVIYSNNIISYSCKYVNGQLQGEYLEYFKNGVLQSKSNYVNNKKHGESVEYYDNGQLKTIQSYHHGVFNGPYFVYDENGGLLVKGNTILGKPVGYMYFFGEKRYYI